MNSLDSYKTRSQLNVNGTHFDYYSLPALESSGVQGISQLPHSLKILLENLLRYEDNLTVNRDDIQALCNWIKEKKIRSRNSLSSRTCTDAGFHWCTGGR